MRIYIPAFEQYLSACHSIRTVKTYGAILALFADFTTRSPPTQFDVESFLARSRRHGGTRSPATRNQELAALRAFAKFATRDLGWAQNPTEGVPFAREAPRDPPVLSMSELRRLFAIAAEIATPAARARALAVLALLSQTGLRVHELVVLDVDQIDIASGTLVAVHGKGGTTHDVPLNAPTIALLISWLARREGITQSGDAALFVSERGRRMSIRSTQRMFVVLRKALGTAKCITPHTLRHTTATLALTLGSDLSTVADLLRHTDLNTTRRYLHLVDERRREAVRRLGAAIPAELIDKDPMPHSDGAPASALSVIPRRNRLDAQYGLGDMSNPGRAA